MRRGPDSAAADSESPDSVEPTVELAVWSSALLLRCLYFNRGGCCADRQRDIQRERLAHFHLLILQPVFRESRLRERDVIVPGRNIVENVTPFAICFDGAGDLCASCRSTGPRHPAQRPRWVFHPPRHLAGSGELRDCIWRYREKKPGSQCPKI
jgi:hypothetical protein